MSTIPKIESTFFELLRDINEIANRQHHWEIPSKDPWVNDVIFKEFWTVTSKSLEEYGKDMGIIQIDEGGIIFCLEKSKIGILQSYLEMGPEECMVLQDFIGK